MIRYKLADGSIVDAEQDCGCLTHDGPHWLHMDDMTKKLNAPLATAGGYAPIGFAREELSRLREKLWHMEQLGIVEILRNGSGA